MCVSCLSKGAGVCVAACGNEYACREEQVCLGGLLTRPDNAHVWTEQERETNERHSCCALSHTPTHKYIAVYWVYNYLLCMCVSVREWMTHKRAKNSRRFTTSTYGDNENEG